MSNAGNMNSLCICIFVSGKTKSNLEVSRLLLFHIYHYRPQTKFAKVIFLHLSVSYSVHRGEYLGRCPPRYSPADTPLRAGTPPQAGTPPRQVHPPGQVHHQQVHPRPQYMLGYGQQAGGTHPTGMHSCFVTKLFISVHIQMA